MLSINHFFIMVIKNILISSYKIIIDKKATKRNPLIPLMNEGLGELKCRRHFLEWSRKLSDISDRTMN